MADEVLDLSAPGTAPDLRGDAKLNQFRKDLSHILLSIEGGPELTIGDYVLRFKTKAPVDALAELIGGEDRVAAMRQYVLLCLIDGQADEFKTLLGKIDLEGLGEIIGALGEGYSSFPEKS